MLKRKRVNVIFRTPSMRRFYDGLKDNNILKKKIDRAIDSIKQNPFNAGQPIGKNLIPKEYLMEGFDNAFHKKLGRDWRLIYSLTSVNEIEILCIVLDWFDDHKKYARKFKYE